MEHGLPLPGVNDFVIPESKYRLLDPFGTSTFWVCCNAWWAQVIGGTSHLFQRPLTVFCTALTAGKLPAVRVVHGDCERVYGFTGWPSFVDWKLYGARIIHLISQEVLIASRCVYRSRWMTFKLYIFYLVSTEMHETRNIIHWSSVIFCNSQSASLFEIP